MDFGGTVQCAVASTLVVLYLSLVKFLRWQRIQALAQKYKHLKKDPSVMTITEAQDIIQLSTKYDMPGLQHLSNGLLLLRTYGIVSPILDAKFIALLNLHTIYSRLSREFCTQLANWPL